MIRTDKLQFHIPLPPFLFQFVRHPVELVIDAMLFQKLFVIAFFHDAVMGAGCVEKSRGVAEQLRIVAERQGVHFMDAAECEFNEVDFMHLTCKGHARLAELLTAEVPKLV